MANEIEPQTYLKTPTALTFWTLGSGVLGGVATMIVTKRAEKGNWSKVKAAYIIGGVVLASLLNIIIALKIKGE